MNAVYTPKYHKEEMAGYVPCLSETPSVIGIWPSGVCNFKCKYCIQSASKEVKQSEAFPEQLMDWDVFHTFAEQLYEFKTKPHTAVFCGVGEPLLHARLPEMVDYLKGNQLVNRVEVVTNGSLLERRLSRELIKAGVDMVMVSVQGLTADAYREVCGYNVNMDQFMEQIRFLYESRNNCHIHVKALDVGIPLCQKEEFLNAYGDFCDTIHIDYVTPLFKNVDYSGMVGEVRDQYNGQPLDMNDEKICTLPFQSLFIQPDGDVVPCCLTPNPACYGNVNDQSLLDICHSQKRLDFLRMHLAYQSGRNPICRQCVQPHIVT